MMKEYFIASDFFWLRGCTKRVISSGARNLLIHFKQRFLIPFLMNINSFHFETARCHFERSEKSQVQFQSEISQSFAAANSFEMTFLFFIHYTVVRNIYRHFLSLIKIFLFLLIFSTLAFSQYNRPGSTDAQFLKIGISPRGTAMSDAYISSVHGAEATYYNSAALPWIKGTDIVFNHNKWFAGINHEFFASAHNFGELGTIGLSFTGLYTDEMKVRTPLQPEGTGETFYSGNYRYALSYARQLTDRVTIGATISYINMSLYSGFSANAVSVDIAALYVSDFRGFRFAMQIANFGSSIQYVNEDYPLPTNFTFGLGMNAIDGDEIKFLVCFAAVKPNEGEPIAQVGGEWSYNNLFFIRGGYRLNNEIAKFSFGSGVRFDVSSMGLRFDYSYSDYSLLGAAHRIGLGVSY